MAEQTLAEPVVTAPGTQDTTVTQPDQAKTAEEGSTTLLGKDVETKPEVVVPEKYEIKVPEGMTLNPKMVETLTPVFKEMKLSQDQVQKLSDTYAPIIKEQREAEAKLQADEYAKTIKEWREASIKELGAEHEKAMASASKFINKFADDPKAVRAFLDETGFGDNPLIVKMFNKAGKAIVEDSFVEGGASNKSTATDGSILYDHPTSQATLKR